MQIVPGSGFFPSKLLHPYTEAYIDAMTVKPTTQRIAIYDRLVNSLVRTGQWEAMDFFYIAANFSEESSLINLINPGYADLTPIGTASFTPDEGWTGGASGANNLTNGVSFNALPKLSLNSAHLGVYSRFGTHARIASSAGAAGPFIALLRTSDTVLTGYVNSTSTDLQATVTTTDGYSLVNRSGASAGALYQDFLSVDTGTQASTSVPSGALYAPGYLNNSNASQFSILHAGSSLTATQVGYLSTHIEAYLMAVGAI